MITSHSFNSLHSLRWRGKEAITTMQYSWWDYIVCQRSLFIVRAKGSSRKVSVCISQGGVADNAGPGSIPALLLPHPSALRSLPFISHSGRGLKVGLIHDDECSPWLPRTQWSSLLPSDPPYIKPCEAGTRFMCTLLSSLQPLLCQGLCICFS